MWVFSDAGAYEPPFGFRGLGAGGSAAVMRSSLNRARFVGGFNS